MLSLVRSSFDEPVFCRSKLNEEENKLLISLEYLLMCCSSVMRCRQTDKNVGGGSSLLPYDRLILSSILVSFFLSLFDEETLLR